MWSAGISVESYARLASRVYSRGDRFLYGYYNSEQPLIQVKICTAVDKEKGLVEVHLLWRSYFHVNGYFNHCITAYWFIFWLIILYYRE